MNTQLSLFEAEHREALKESDVVEVYEPTAADVAFCAAFGAHWTDPANLRAIRARAKTIEIPWTREDHPKAYDARDWIIEQDKSGMGAPFERLCDLWPCRKERPYNTALEMLIEAVAQVRWENGDLRAALQVYQEFNGRGEMA